MGKKEVTPEELVALIKDRLALGAVEMSDKEFHAFMEAADEIDMTEGMEVPQGYKKCGGCKKIKKFHLFNKNTSNKTGCTGNCKACQKASASKSYAKTKKKRNYAKYYQENKEMKKAHAKKYYEENKDRLDERHKEYLQTKKGKNVMKKARAKRNALLEQNKGIDYNAELIIQRDTVDGVLTCYLCGQPIEDPSKGHIDHVIGVAIGGMNCFSNVMLVHNTCNLRKTKSCDEVMPKTVDDLISRTEQFMDENPELF